MSSDHTLLVPMLLTHVHRSIDYHNQTQSLVESTERLTMMYLHGLNNSTSKWFTTSLVELMYRLCMYDTPPSVLGVLTSSNFISLSFITPTPSQFLSLDLDFPVIINNPKVNVTSSTTVHRHPSVNMSTLSPSSRFVSRTRRYLLMGLVT